MISNSDHSITWNTAENLPGGKGQYTTVFDLFIDHSLILLEILTWQFNPLPLKYAFRLPHEIINYSNHYLAYQILHEIIACQMY